MKEATDPQMAQRDADRVPAKDLFGELAMLMALLGMAAGRGRHLEAAMLLGDAAMEANAEDCLVGDLLALVDAARALVTDLQDKRVGLTVAVQEAGGAEHDGKLAMAEQPDDQPSTIHPQPAEAS